MLLRHHHMMRSGFEPETLSTVARMSSTPSGADFIAYDYLIKAIKQGQALPLRINNLYTKFNTLYVRAAHDSQAALLNWANSSFDASISGSPTFTQYVGFRSAASGYLYWDFDPSTDSTFSTSNYLAGAYVTSNPTRGNKSALGLVQTTPSESTIRIFPRNASDSTTLLANQATSGGVGFTSITDMRAFYYMGRTNSNDTFGGRDLATGGTTTGIRNFHSGNVFELATNNIDAGPQFFLDADVSFSFWGTCNSLNVPNLRTAVRDYLLMRGISGI